MSDDIQPQRQFPFVKLGLVIFAAVFLAIVAGVWFVQPARLQYERPRGYSEIIGEFFNSNERDAKDLVFREASIKFGKIQSLDVLTLEEYYKKYAKPKGRSLGYYSLEKKAMEKLPYASFIEITYADHATNVAIVTKSVKGGFYINEFETLP